MGFWKLLDHSYVQIVPSQQLRRHIDNSILRDTLQLYILRTWINMRTKSFIKTSVNVTETKIDECAWKKISHAKLQAWIWKNIWTKIEVAFHLFYALLFLWNLVFKFNVVLIGNFFYNFHHNLFTFLCLFFHTWYIADLKVYPVPLRFSASKCSCYVLFFMKNVYLIIAKINLDVNNCL